MGHAKQRILLVDDDPGIMVAVKQSLMIHGYEMTTASDGLEALAAFDRELPELVLLDLVMPHCSGLEVCHKGCKKKKINKEKRLKKNKIMREIKVEQK